MIIRIVFSILCLISLSVHSVELESSKSQALLDDIRQDINRTLSQVMELEGDRDWTVFLTRPSGKLIRIGVIIEPSSNLVLSVTADGIGTSLGLQPGDFIQELVLNKENYHGNFSKMELTHGDDVKALIQREGKNLKLETVVSSSFVPRWELYSSSLEGTPKNMESIKKTGFELVESEEAIKMLEKLQERINLRLSNIYHLESKISDSDVRFNLKQDKLRDVRLGMSIDQKTSRVIRVNDNSNADRVGLQVGDIIISVGVNDKTFKEVAEVNFSEGDTLSFTVDRAGKEHKLSSTLTADEIPSWALEVNSNTEYPDSACGVVSFLFTPKVSEEIYNVEASKLDGDSVLGSKVIYELKAGEHIFTLYDKIPSREVLPTFSRRRPYKQSKELAITIEPNKRYYLAAKFDRSKRWKVRNGEYWKPFVWKVEDYECSLDD